MACALLLVVALPAARAQAVDASAKGIEQACRGLVDGNALGPDAEAVLVAQLPPELGYAQRSPGEKRAILAKLAQAMIDAERDHACARAMYVEAERLEPGNLDDAMGIVYLDAGWLDRPEAAAERVAILARTRVADFAPYERFLHALVRELPVGSAARRQLLQAFYDADWQPEPPGAGNYWLELAEHYLAEGNTAAARAAVERISIPSMIVRLRADRRFDAIVERDSPRLDSVRAAHAQLDVLRRHADAHPRRLQPMIELNAALLELGQDAEVIALVDKVEARKAAAGDGARLFDDPKRYPWLLLDRASALLRQRRVDAALAEFERASRDRYGRSDPDIWFNLAHLYLRLERGADARAALARSGDELNAAGRVAKAYLEYRTARLLDDRAAEASALVYVLGHADDAPAFARKTLLEADRTEDAAARLIADLASPTARGDLLGRLQYYERPAPLPGDVTRSVRWEALLARDDVRTAIEVAGRREHYALYTLRDSD